MRVTAAPLAPGYREAPYWFDDLTLPEPAPAPLPTSCDVVVVGGGYTGMAVAEELARRGRHVVVLEAGPLGAGASTRNGGMAHPGTKHGPAELLDRFGTAGRALYLATVDAFDGLEKRLAELGVAVECSWSRSGHVEVAHRPSRADGLRRDAAVLQDELGQSARFVSAEELASETGSAAHHGGLLVEHSGGLHPGRWYAALATAALGAGSEVHTGTAVTAVDRASGPGFSVATTRESVRAGDVVVATDALTGPWLPWLRRRILAVGSYIVATEPLEPGLAAAVSPKGRMLFDTRHFLSYWRPSPDGTRMLFGGRTSFAPTTVAAARDRLHAAMVRMYPQLAGVAVTHAWGGNVALTRDRLPHAGRDPRSGVAFALGYCGTGVALSHHLGRLVGAWVAGDAAAGDRLRPFADPRWPVVPAPARVPRLLAAAGWWYQARDRL